MWNYIKLAALGIMLVLFGLAANYGRDFAYQVHALIFMAATAITFIYTLRTMGDARPAPSGYMDGVIRYGVVATACLYRHKPDGDCRTAWARARAFV